ncbi:recombinase XerC [Brevirhabdus pacifica]|uniref:Recombinase XerC n=1 Tax=Brevirhabdus pacifica TaxID=1267768 RepID=A0A1U7DHE2_9RHOB|nr:DUF484 family protein [Brevirhabdus pacifica]APX89402.1 recombinase XerC [Brevirhabdus pacifica]OWU76572.1 recombinase XerC [Loktanella sp. 22II-4b]PJJ85959.1 hypothetical protein CLV77_0491 [Brevirhabdus pacifica]
MSDTALNIEDLRERILSDPEMILDDRDLMKALIAANEKQLGNNIVDLRGIAMERLEARLDRLEDTHRSVIAAAYENLAGTNQVHRAILRLLDAAEFEDFLLSLRTDIAEHLRVDAVKLILESPQADTGSDGLTRLSDVLLVKPQGFVAEYSAVGRNGAPQRQVTLRQVADASDEVFGEAAGWVHSEALLRLDLGPGRLPGMLVMGAEDPHQFKPNQGTDLLTFFTGVFERAMRRWLS